MFTPVPSIVITLICGLKSQAEVVFDSRLRSRRDQHDETIATKFANFSTRGECTGYPSCGHNSYKSNLTLRASEQLAIGTVVKILRQLQ